MSNSQNAAESVHPTTAKAVRRCITAIRAIFETKTEDEAGMRLDALLAKADESARFADALYRAVQQLRDLAELEPEEGVFLFDEIYHCREFSLPDDQENERTMRAYEIARGKAKDGEALSEWFLDRASRREQEIRAAFHRARGELALAALCTGEEDVYGHNCILGERWLVSDKPAERPAKDLSAKASEVGVVLEHLIAYSAAEAGPARFASTLAYDRAVSRARYGSALAAIRQAREMNIITAAQSAGLIDDIVGPRVLETAEADRTYARLVRMAEWRHPRAGKLSKAEREKLPDQIEARMSCLMIIELRRVGEHWMADLLVHDQDAYARMCEETSHRF